MKVKSTLQKLKDLFTGLFNLASYTEKQEAVDATLANVATQMSKIATNLAENTAATTKLSENIDGLDKEINKIKDALQIELFGSLQALHARLKEQHFATVEQKREAHLYYTQIHNLGKDGWSELYYKEIIEMPESREEYWKRLNEQQ